MSKWEQFGLPGNLRGKSFIDVGCWEGNICLEAADRGAKTVIGTDYCTSPELSKALESGKFSFIQLDIFSEKFLSLPLFDVVYSAGVLYHVENPMSYLVRLRNITAPSGVVYLETTYLDEGDAPIMVFHPDNTLDENPSNWWSPNERCLCEMMRAAGFTDLRATWRSQDVTVTTDRPPANLRRLCITGTVAKADLAKTLPRRPSFMPDAAAAGSRIR